MKAFLLAAGLGTRLRPLTDVTPKCLLPIRGTPLLAIWLELCANAGIRSVLVNVHAHGEAVKDFLGTHTFPLTIELAEEPELLGSAGTLAVNQAFVAGEKEFFVLYGDVLTNADLEALRETHLRSGKIVTLGLNRVPDPRRCGVVVLDASGTVVDFQEKPANPANNLVFSGIMVAHPEFLEYLPEHRPADIGFDVLPRLRGRMAGREIDAYLTDIGTMQTYTNAQREWPGLAKGRQC